MIFLAAEEKRGLVKQERGSGGATHFARAYTATDGAPKNIPTKPPEKYGTTEVQLLSFVCSTGNKGSKPRLWNIQNLGAVPSYDNPRIILVATVPALLGEASYYRLLLTVRWASGYLGKLLTTDDRISPAGSINQHRRYL